MTFKERLEEMLEIAEDGDPMDAIDPPIVVALVNFALECGYFGDGPAEPSWPAKYTRFASQDLDAALSAPTEAGGRKDDE
jgi:hypothetical protein